MAGGILLEVLDKSDKFDIYFDSWIKLLEKSIDDAILGYQTKFTKNKNLLLKEGLFNQIDQGLLKIVIGKTQTNNVVVTCIIRSNNQSTNDHIYDLQKGFIDPSYRKSGLLEKTLLFIANIAIDNNVDILTLDVRESTKAHKVWQKVGFRTYGTLKDYSRYNGKSFSGHYMSITTQNLLNNLLNLEKS